MSGKIKSVFLFLQQLLSRIKIYRRKVYVFGDSHVEVFEYLNEKKLTRIDYVITKVPGATASGLANPNSVTKALETFERGLNEIPKNSKIIFLLGEVDTGFLIWYMAEKKNLPVKELMENSINNYVKFLIDCKCKGYKNLYIMSAPLPTIKDNQNFGEIANKRKEVKATQIQRTNLTIEYNNKLKASVEQIGCSFISFDNYLIAPQNNLIDSIYLNDDPTDHHLNKKTYSDIVIKRFRESKVF